MLPVEKNDEALLKIADAYFKLFIAINKERCVGRHKISYKYKGQADLAIMMESAVKSGRSGNFSFGGVLESLVELEEELARDYFELQEQAVAIEAHFITKTRELCPHLTPKKNFLKNIANLFVQHDKKITDNTLEKLAASKVAFRSSVKTCLHHKERVMEMLCTYSGRIKGYEGKFDTGFTFFKESQAKNRKANYELSIKLQEELKKGDVNIAKLFSASNISALRGGTIRSDELNDAIETARNVLASS